MRVCFYTLGCKVNLNETGALEQMFRGAGFTIVPEGEEADVFVVNSCTVTNFGDQKSRKWLRRAKRENPGAVTVLTGCYPQAFPEEAAQFMEADLVCGNGDRKAILDNVLKLLDGSAAAAAELLYEVICAMRVEITPHIADCLYTGLSTDTGCFKFSSTKASTHITAAKLMEAGAHVEELNTLLFDTKSRERMEAERIARNHLEYHLDGRCALIYLTRDEIEQSRVDPADLEELTSLPISIEGVKVGLTLRQQPGGSYRISVRTAKGVDACAIARRLGGGGHTRAAGCELLGNLDNAKSAILSEVEAVLDAPQEEA